MGFIFETERLGVRKFETRDAEALYSIHLDDAVAKWFPNECYKDIEEAKGAIDFYIKRVDEKRLPYVLAVELKESGELIGDSGVSAVEGKENEVEIGYVISKRHTGKGYATELVRAVSEFMASTFSAKVIYGRVIRGNDASARVLENSGFTFLGEDHGASDDPYGNGMLVYRKDT